MFLISKKHNILDVKFSHQIANTIFNYRIILILVILLANNILFAKGLSNYYILVKDMAIIPINTISMIEKTTIQIEDDKYIIKLANNAMLMINNGNQQALINDKPFDLGYIPIMYNNNLYIPIKSIAKQLNLIVNFDAESGSIKLRNPTTNIVIIFSPLCGVKVIPINLSAKLTNATLYYTFQLERYIIPQIFNPEIWIINKNKTIWLYSYYEKDININITGVYICDIIGNNKNDIIVTTENTGAYTGAWFLSV